MAQILAQTLVWLTSLFILSEPKGFLPGRRLNPVFKGEQKSSAVWYWQASQWQVLIRHNCDRIHIVRVTLGTGLGITGFGRAAFHYLSGECYARGKEMLLFYFHRLLSAKWATLALVLTGSVSNTLAVGGLWQQNRVNTLTLNEFLVYRLFRILQRSCFLFPHTNWSGV